MRVVYQIFIGMIFFNAFFIMFTPYFDTAGTGYEDNAVNVTDNANLTQYKVSGGLDISNLIVSAISIFGLSIAGLGILERLSGVSLSLSFGTIMAIALITSVLTTTWLALAETFVPLLQYANESSIINLVDFYNIFMVVFGIIFALTIAEFLAGQSGVDT